MHSALQHTDHRSAPMPRGPWIMLQRARKEGPRPAEFRARYWPVSTPRRWEKGRARVFPVRALLPVYGPPRNSLRAYIHHLPWPLQNADAEIETNTVALADGIELPGQKPLLHYSRELQVLIWWPEPA